MDKGKQEDNLRVSVIIPVYNTEEYVEEAVRSIMNQTLKEIEIIIIDDGSTDHSLSVIKKLATEDNRIRYLTQTNQGQSIARNLGIEIAKGEFIYFMDSDDLLEVEALEFCSMKIEKDQLDFLLFNAVILNKAHKFNISIDYKIPQLNDNQVYSGKSMISELLMQRAYRCSPCIHFIRRKIIDSFQLRFYPGIIHEDELFSALLYLQAERAGYINNAFFKRRLRADSVMTTKYSMKNVHSYLVVVEQLLLFAKNSDKQSNELARRVIAYILDPNIYRASAFSLRERMSVLWICLFRRLLPFISFKSILVLLFPWTIKLKSILKKNGR